MQRLSVAYKILQYLLCSLQKSWPTHFFSPFFLSADTKLFTLAGSESAYTEPLELEGSGAGEDGVGGARKQSRVGVKISAQNWGQ